METKTKLQEELILDSSVGHKDANVCSMFAGCVPNMKKGLKKALIGFDDFALVAHIL